MVRCFCYMCTYIRSMYICTQVHKHSVWLHYVHTYVVHTYQGYNRRCLLKHSLTVDCKVVKITHYHSDQIISCLNTPISTWLPWERKIRNTQPIAWACTGGNLPVFTWSARCTYLFKLSVPCERQAVGNGSIQHRLTYSKVQLLL